MLVAAVWAVNGERAAFLKLDQAGFGFRPRPLVPR
jgi:hypothetical protein